VTAPCRSLRVACGALVGIFFCLESGCSGGAPPSAANSATPPRPAQASPSSSPSDAYDRLRVRAWDRSRRFKALFNAEVSPKIGAIGRGYLSVWWDGAAGTLTWRASAPIGGAGKGGFLGKGMSDGASPFPGNLAPSDLIACILGVPEGPLSDSVAVDREGRVIRMSFPSGEVVALQPGEGVPRRIEANGPDGRAVLTLEAYSSWPESEEVPSQ
jgi:hypothetical protein